MCAELNSFNTLFYVGTYTVKTSKGIYGVYYNSITKETKPPVLLAEAVSPSYIMPNHSKTVLYAVSEPWDGTNGAVTAYKIDPATGHLQKINEVKAPGTGLCHLTIDSNDRLLFTVSYGDGTVQIYPLNKDGSIEDCTCMQTHSGRGPHPTRQEKAHAHSVCLTPDESYLCVCDLGIDELVVYDIDYETGQITKCEDKSIKLPSGCGPRHMVFHPTGKYAYIIAELSSQVVALTYNKAQGFSILQVIDALEDSSVESTAAAIRITDNGEYLYASNRGEDSIAHFQVEQASGKLERVANTSTQGKHPRDFILAQNDSLVVCANQDTDNLVFYDVQDNGNISAKKEAAGISMPACIIEYKLLI